MTLIPSLLILIFILFFAVSFWWVLKTRDDLFAVFYAFLFIYTVFTQIGYVFFPEGAIKLRVYFGIDLFYSYWLFVFLSFVATVGLFLITHFLRRGRSVLELPAANSIRLPRILFFLLVGGYLITLIVLFFENYEGIRYANIEDAWVSYLINFQPLVVLILYMKWRKSTANSFEKLVTVLMLLAAAGLLLLISLRAGQRLAGLSLLVGVIAFELGPFIDNLRKLGDTSRNHRTRLLLIAAAAVVFLVIAGRIVALRNEYAGELPIEALSDILADKGDPTTFDPQQIVHADYFAPSSLLFVSMATNWINPGEVLRSNVYNYVVFTKYPYLSNILSEAANPIAFSRNESYGYYLLTEGFNFAGWFGILYNAVMVNLGLGLWRFFASSRDRRFNKYVTAVLCLLVVGLVRGPSVYFVRNTYLAILPAMGLISLALGYYPKRSRNSIRKKSPPIGLARNPQSNVRFNLIP